jgi:hypothetical protein
MNGVETRVYPLRQRVTGSEQRTFSLVQRLSNGTETKQYALVQQIGVEAPSLPPVDPNETYVPPANRSTLVIEHVMTGKRYMFPRHNINMETPTGFVQTQYVPREFKLSEDQSPVPNHFYHNAQHPYPGQPKDALNQYYWRDKPWS